MSLIRRTSSPLHGRFAAAALALLMAGGIACSGGGTGPDGRAARLLASGAAASFVYQYDDLRTEPLLAAGPVVADTLRLTADHYGQWRITYLEPPAFTARRVNEVEVFWNVFAGDSIIVSPSCGPPTALCDPLPPWKGRVIAGRALVLANPLQAAASSPRSYARVTR